MTLERMLVRFRALAQAPQYRSARPPENALRHLQVGRGPAQRQRYGGCSYNCLRSDPFERCGLLAIRLRHRSVEHISKYKSNTCIAWVKHALGMAGLCIYCQCIPRFCSRCSVLISRHRCCLWTVCVTDCGLCMGRLVDDQTKGRPRTAWLHHLQHVQ